MVRNITIVNDNLIVFAFRLQVVVDNVLEKFVFEENVDHSHADLHDCT